MFARYDQDLTPFFVRIRAAERAQLRAGQRALRLGLASLWALLGRRQKA